MAEKATPGPWRYEKKGGSGPGVKTFLVLDSRDWPVGTAYDLTIVNEQNAAHIAANDPGTVIEDINEILRLRAEVASLEKEADWLAQCAANVGWHDLRVSRELMREQARKVVEEQCKK